MVAGHSLKLLCFWFNHYCDFGLLTYSQIYEVHRISPPPPILVMSCDCLQTFPDLIQQLGFRMSCANQILCRSELLQMVNHICICKRVQLKSMTASLPGGLFINSVLPPSLFHYAFIPWRENSVFISEILFFHFLNLCNLKLCKLGNVCDICTVYFWVSLLTSIW